MKKPTKTKRVKREDYHRALLTEVCPYEVPVIFDNYGFYLQIKAYNTNYSDYPDLVSYLFFDKDKKKLLHTFYVQHQKRFFFITHPLTNAPQGPVKFCRNLQKLWRTDTTSMPKK